MNPNNVRTAVEELFGECHPVLMNIRLMSPADRLQFVEVMDEDEETCTDPDMKQRIALEHEVMRMMLRLWPSASLQCGLTETEQDHLDEYFGGRWE